MWVSYLELPPLDRTYSSKLRVADPVSLAPVPITDRQLHSPPHRATPPPIGADTGRSYPRIDVHHGRDIGEPHQALSFSADQIHNAEDGEAESSEDADSEGYQATSVTASYGTPTKDHRCDARRK